MTRLPYPPTTKMVKSHTCAHTDGGKVVCLDCTRSWRQVDDHLFADGPCEPAPDHSDHFKLRLVELGLFIVLGVAVVLALAL